MTAQDRNLVVVTGASGFIASHCVKLLLARGYRVRGTVRELTKSKGYHEALSLDEEQRSRLEFRQADLTLEEGWDQAMEGAHFVLHTASPVPLSPPKDLDALLPQALEGTKRVLQAAARAGVKRAVVTSSIAAVVSGHEHTPGREFTEADWSDVERGLAAYARSKTLAERAAWDLQAGLGEGQRFELATVNPGFVLGPSLLGVDSPSNELVRKLIDREVPGVPRLYIPVVDVRDVAEAHLLAMTDEKAPGERFILVGHEAWYGDIAQILKEGGYRVPTSVVPNWAVHLIALFDKAARHIVPELNWEYHPRSGKAQALLGWHCRDLRSSVLDTAQSIVERRSA